MDDIHRIGVVIELIILSVLGIIGNALVIAVYARQKYVHSPVIFILTLAVTDFITCLITIPFTIATEIVAFRLRFDFFCKLYYFLLTSTVPFSAFMMTAIAVDRFLCIVGPRRYQFSVLVARILAVCLAVLAATSGIITSLMYGVHQDNHPYYFDGQCMGTTEHLPFKAARIWQKLYSSFYLICGAMVILLYAIIYVVVLKKHNVRTLVGRNASRIHRNNTELTPMNQSDQTTNEDTPVMDVADGVSTNEINAGVTADGLGTSLPEQNATRRLSTRKQIQFGFMLSVVAFGYLICFLPAWLMAHGVIHFNAYVFYFYFSYHVTNPVIYSLMSSSFRRKLAKRCCRPQTGQDINVSSTSLDTTASQ